MDHKTGTVAPELDLLGERRELSIAGMRLAGRRRRPSGEMAPLPRELSFSGKLWLAAGVGILLLWVSLFAAPSTTGWWTDRDLTVLEWLEGMRTETGITVAKAMHWLSSEWVVRTLRLGTILALIAFRRWRHLFAVLVAILAVSASVDLVRDAIGRIRPTIDIVGPWSGPSHPSAPVASLAVTAMAMTLALIPQARYRVAAAYAGAVLTMTTGLGRIYLGIDHPSDVIVAALYAPAVAFVLFRWVAPNAGFPVTWRRGVKAHLDISGARRRAIEQAVKEQIGVEVHDIAPFKLERAAGSTPLRLRLAATADADAFLFAKLYSQTHLSSDRWYKLGRSILYGSLEDEVRFTTVRRLVEHEDYVQRVMAGAGVPGPAPIGIIEITPEREYVLVCEFLEDAKDITAVEATEQLIDDALGIVRTMWDAGLAHRDIKPSNVMVSGDRVFLIDYSFGMVRPSPWRQAVDLANMMLILGLTTDAATVYERALQQFAPADVAEAFAATRSVTIPRDTRAMLAELEAERGIDLVAEFQKISPHREPIAIQRWSPRRIFRTAVAVGAVALLVLQVWSEFRGTGVL